METKNLSIRVPRILPHKSKQMINDLPFAKGKRGLKGSLGFFSSKTFIFFCMNLFVVRANGRSEKVFEPLENVKQKKEVVLRIWSRFWLLKGKCGLAAFMVLWHMRPHKLENAVYQIFEYFWSCLQKSPWCNFTDILISRKNA